jgi:hypothetical protein
MFPVFLGGDFGEQVYSNKYKDHRGIPGNIPVEGGRIVYRTAREDIDGLKKELANWDCGDGLKCPLFRRGALWTSHGPRILSSGHSSTQTTVTPTYPP